MNIHHRKTPCYTNIFDNQEYTTPSQSVRQSCNSVFLDNKNYVEDKNGSRPLDRSTGKVRFKILHSLNALLTRKCKATEYTKYRIPKFIFRSIHWDMKVCSCSIHVFLWSTEDAPMTGSQDVILNTAQSCRPHLWASLCPSTVNLAICPDTAQQFHVQEEPFLSFCQAIPLTISTPLGHLWSSDVVEWTLSTINTSIFPAMHIWIPGYSWNCLLDVVVLAKSSSLIRPLPCPTPVQDDASQSMTSVTSRRQPFQKTSRTFILTVLLLTPGHWDLPSNTWQH